MTDANDHSYRPRMSQAEAEALRRWHESAYQEMRARGQIGVSYLGHEFLVPAEVFAPTPMSDLLGTAVLTEVRAEDRVLDMGTGCGVNAVLAASKAHEVVGVDINPDAIAAAKANAVRHGVADRTSFLVSDVFEAVEGTFDLMIIDPPFRWFEPRDMLEASMADPGYRAITRFIEQSPARLREGGRILLFFGSSGDIDYVTELVDRNGFDCEVVASRSLCKDNVVVVYKTWLLTR